MAISKEKKQELIALYKELIANNSGVVLASYSNISVKEMEGLRAKVRDLGGELHVVKNRIVRKAFDDAGSPLPVDLLQGTTAAGFATDEIPAVAKAILDLGRETAHVKIKGGLVNGVVYRASQMEQLAELPPLPVLRAQLLGVIQAPARGVASVIAGSVRQVVNVVKAYADSEAA